MRDYVLNQYQLADALGKSQAAVSTTITLNRLPEDVRDACRTNPTGRRSTRPSRQQKSRLIDRIVLIPVN